MAKHIFPGIQSLQPLLLLSVLSISVYVLRLIVTGSDRYWFLNWNLVLAWLPLIFAFGLRKILRERPWASWQAILLTIGWFSLLPNSFYLVSDFVHLNISAQNEVSLLYDIVLLVSFGITGLAIGCASTYMVHMELKKRLSWRNTWVIVGLVFMLSGFAVYLGRFLGWNSWDLILNLPGITSDILDRIINPSLYPNTFTITLLFFAFIMTVYSSFYSFVQSLTDQR
ncbi:DUF1361 domain-containing protein [Candidatus Saccharibacteria bacterium]|nr:DUF1361 domain-containing protein [Candidatus Saccharibacteria bacterium]